MPSPVESRIRRIISQLAGSVEKKAKADWRRISVL